MTAAGLPTSGGRREQPPRLVLRFAVLTALGLAAAAAVLLVVDRHANTVQAQRQAIARARFAANAVLAHELRPGDLTAQTTPKRRRQLDRLFKARVLREGITHATLHRADGRATYATEGPLGREPVPAAHLADALRGVVVSEVGVAADGSPILRSYVPVVLGPKRVRGVVALEQDYGPIEAAGRASSWLVAGVLEGLLLLLLLVFVPVLARVSARIRRHVDELEQVATHDELTGLPNRLGFRRAVEEMAASLSPSGAVLLLDVDRFYEISDAVGPESSDTLLVQVAQRLQRDLAGCGLMARIDGDEFALLLTTASRAEIVGVAERGQASLAPPFLVHGVRIAIEASGGAAILGEHGWDADTVLRRAGVALSIAKEEGRRSLQIYDPGHDRSDVSRLALLAELREAMDAGQLLVHYQPQADLATRGIRGVEALVRWQHPQRGLLSAGAFIGQVEHSGLAKELSRFVLEESARQWRVWDLLGLRLELAVNLSAVDVLDVTFPEQIGALLERHGLPPEDLILEITERTLVGDERRADLVLERLHRMGVRLALDDFGTGYSSLACLRRLPFRQVKLDRSFLSGIPGDAADETIVSSTVEIAHALGATVVAEGVETVEQWEGVSRLRCDIAQGYLIGKPMPAAELTEQLRTARVVPRVAAA